MFPAGRFQRFAEGDGNPAVDAGPTHSLWKYYGSGASVLWGEYYLHAACTRKRPNSGEPLQRRVYIGCDKRSILGTCRFLPLYAGL